MYVCVCNAVRDRDIRAAVDDGVVTMRELQKRLGVSAVCGKCAPCARQILTEKLTENIPPDSLSSGRVTPIRATG